MREYLDSLGRWRALTGAVPMLPSHGRPFQGAAARVAALESHCGARLALVRAACAAGPKSAAERLPVPFARAHAAHRTMFAMGETIAHSNHREHAGVIAHKRGADGVFRYRRLVRQDLTPAIAL